MSKAINAALLSGLVIPGAGQLYLGKKRLGSVLIILVIIAITLLFMEVNQQVNSVLEQLQQQGGAVSTERIIELASESASQSSGMMINLATLLFTGSWLFGVIDAYRSGKRQALSSAA